MGKKIHYCYNCNNYTFSDTCKYCNLKCFITNPPKYSIIDKYKKYRQMYIEEKYE